MTHILIVEDEPRLRTDLVDFLGLRTLTVLANTVELIRESRGMQLDLDAVPLDDRRAYALLSEARTFGVFQLESPGMREALRGLKPERLEDVIAMVSLAEPPAAADRPTRSSARASLRPRWRG